jgi:cytochrome c-type biogenesis protein CcmH
MRAYRRGGAAAASPRRALAACAAVALTALGIYLAVGRPDLPDAPYAARIEALRHRDRSTYGAEEWLAVLADDARREPNNPGPLFYEGQIYLALGRPREAARAFDAALRRDPHLVAAMMGLGRALVQIDGRVTPDALSLFQQAGAASNDPAPWVYQAMAAMEAGQDEQARSLWGAALARMGPDHPMREAAQRFASGQTSGQ